MYVLTKKVMDINLYNDIVSEIQNYKGLTKDCTITMQQKYPNVHPGTISSIVSQECQKRVKLSNYKDTVDMENLYSTFKQFKQENNATGFLLNLAVELGIAPSIIARRALKQHFTEIMKQEQEDEELFSKFSLSSDELQSSDTESELSERKLSDEESGASEEELDLSNEDSELPSDVESEVSTDTQYSRSSDDTEQSEPETYQLDRLPLKAMIRLCIQDHSLIGDADLAYEVFQCTLFDDQYSPFADTIKHNLGQQYEIRLQRHLHARDIPYQDEHGLRKHGYDKTPDIKLDVPISLNGLLINWIESKALFGSEEIHNAYIEDQYKCYWNRFGPGLVIYWFGFVDRIVDPFNTKMLILDNIPDQLEIVREPSNNVNNS